VDTRRAGTRLQPHLQNLNKFSRAPGSSFNSLWVSLRTMARKKMASTVPVGRRDG
jgi:hypothetical protein